MFTGLVSKTVHGDTVGDNRVNEPHFEAGTLHLSISKRLHPAGSAHSNSIPQNAPSSRPKSCTAPRLPLSYSAWAAAGETLAGLRLAERVRPVSRMHAGSRCRLYSWLRSLARFGAVR